MRKIFLISLITLLLPRVTIEAQNNKFGISDSTFVYYSKCISHQRDRVVLSMADTLFKMASKEGDVRMEVVSSTLKMDYYYYAKDLDSLKIAVDLVKDFAKETKLMRYYYFSWARLVSYYINKHYYDTALDEIFVMQSDAIKNNNPYAINQSYQMIARIYHSKDMYSDAAFYFLKAANVVRAMDKDDPDRKGLGYLFAAVAGEYVEAKMVNEAKEALKTARDFLETNNEWYSYYMYCSRLALMEKDMKNSKLYLDSLDLFSNDDQKERREYLVVKTRYYDLIGDYESALNMCYKINDKKDEYSSIPPYKYTADLLRRMGRYKEAMEYYSKYIDMADSIKVVDFETDVADKAILYKIREMTAENQKNTIRIRTTWLVVSSVALLCLIIALVVVSIQYRKIKNLNDYLKKSNEIRASFLQDLSHEIRTPLNSIVGFSQVIDDSPDTTSELKNYTKIILNNSKDLLKLFTKAHEAWDVESSDKM